MKRLRARLVAFIVILALFFFVEQFILRLDRLPVGLLALSNAVVFVVVVLFLVSPRVTRRAGGVLIGAGAALLVATRVYFLGTTLVTDRLLFLTTIADVAFLVLLAILARLVADSLAEFNAGVAFLTGALAGNALTSVDQAEAQIQAEITRSRHYRRPLSVIAVGFDETTRNSEIDRLVAEVQERLAERHAYARLAGAIRNVLRPIDLVLDTEAVDTLLVLCPEADEASALVLVERVNATLAAAGVDARCATATFPDEGLTFTALVNEARSRLYRSPTVGDLSAATPEMSGHST